MKIITRAKAALIALTTDVEKRVGLYVSRPVLNAQEWHDWAVKFGVPKPVPAAEMHVTVLYSSVDVKMVPDKTVKTIYIGPGYCDAACFMTMGPNNESLAVCFCDWELFERHWAFIDNGAMSTFPTYRPHMTLTNAVGGFELSDEALAAAPLWINLGPETSTALQTAEPADQDTEGDGEPDDGEMVLVIEIAMTAAQDVIDKSLANTTMGLTPVDRYALADISAGRSVQKGVVRRLAKAAWAPEAIKTLAGAESPPRTVEMDGKKYVERELTMTVKPLSNEVREKLNTTVEAFKTSGDDEQLAWGWASVSTVGGELVKDLQGDTITTKAQRQWLHSLMKSQRAGLMDHGGEQVGEVVEGLVFDTTLQKALGIDLGLEGVLTCTHYTCAKTWSVVKTGNWMHSIAGRVLVEVEGDAA